MARRDTGRWVARAAATGGGRTYRGQLPVRWYGSLFLIVLLGVALVVYSRYERQHPAASTQPTASSHWYVALAFDVCGTVQPNLPANPNEATAAPGLHTAGDGVIQISPLKPADQGNNATLARFVQTYPGLTLTGSTLKIPGKTSHSNGQTCPTGTPDAGKKAQVRIKVWPSFAPPGSNHPFEVANPAALKLADGQLVTVAFVPADASIPKPPASVITTLLQDRSQVATSTTLPSTSVPSVTTTAPSTTAPSTTAPSATTAPPTTTTAPSTTTTGASGH
jgi:hypothetical protein